MLLSAAKLTRLVHKVVVETVEKLKLSADIGRTSVAYRKMLNHLCQLATSDGITLKRLKEEANQIPYLHLRGEADKVAEAVWQGRKDYITFLEKEEKETASKSTTKSTSKDKDSGDGSDKNDSKDE